MNKRQTLEHRSALAEASRVIAFATGQMDRLQAIIVDLDRVGLDSDDARDVLDAAEAHLALLRRQLGVVVRCK